MRKMLLLVVACWATTVVVFADDHLFHDAAYRQKVEQAFADKIRLVGSQFFNVSHASVTTEEMEALKFLYAYMPVADVTDYPTSFYLDQVRSSLSTRQEMAWGNKVPEILFRHFVLPIRVNNENLDNSRLVFFPQLKERVRGMNMRDAILEVNHWCHERVTYQPSDGRTSAPLATICSAYGRCGEESTFTVAALRSIGIPARQVYTPRWAHTDDNHAWVEAWADGEWYFLGACEPEPVLNLGWFNAPASRAMLMHTRAFGDYDGPEEVMLRTSNFTEINLIDHYARTARAEFQVVDQNGLPVSGARVDFKIYNYAEYCTVATKYTDQAGHTFLTSGLGDMMVWASKDGVYGYGKVSFGKDASLTIRLTRSPSTDLRQTVFEVEDYDIVPPPQQVRLPEVTAEQQAINKQRLATEDSMRTAYMSTFLDDHRAREIAQQNGLNPDEVAGFLMKSRGNHNTILRFLVSHKDDSTRANDLLGTLSDKDLRDMPLAILDDHFYAKSSQLCPRVENEMIILPFKQAFEKVFPEKDVQAFRQDPSLLVKWVSQNIRLNPDTKALRIAQTPMGVWRSRLTDTRSRDIFFVDLARSLDIEARKDYVTSKVQYRKENRWIDVDFEAQEQKTAPQGTLVIDFQPTKIVDDPKYYSHFTITRINDGVTQLMNFEEGQVDMGEGVLWSKSFKNGVPLDVGTYELVTGMRMASGNVLSTSQIFNIKEGETTTLQLNLRQSETEIAVIGNFDSESRFTLLDGQEVSLLSQTGRGYFVVGCVGVGQEPTNHALRDIAKVRKSFDKWDRPIVLLFEDETAAAQFRAADYGLLPSSVIYGIDRDGKIRQQIVKNMKLQSDRLLPIFIIADTFNRVVFQSQGYTIGLGEQMERVIQKLDE
ncbi:MAG: transglutaminase domain-containing protein [Prevotella sp.]|nr:transglutaminase domain-containing protein [Prevotella sp.]